MKNKFWTITSHLASTASILAATASNCLYFDLHKICNHTVGQKNLKKPFDCEIFMGKKNSNGGRVRNSFLEAVLEAKRSKILIEGLTQLQKSKSRVGISILSLKWREQWPAKVIVGKNYHTPQRIGLKTNFEKNTSFLASTASIFGLRSLKLSPWKPPLNFPSHWRLKIRKSLLIVRFCWFFFFGWGYPQK